MPAAAQARASGRAGYRSYSFFPVPPGPPVSMPADADERMLAFGETTGPTATMSGPAAAGDSGMNVVHAAVFASRVEKIKQLQRDYPDVRKRCFEQCGMHFDGVKDPYRHDDASIRSVLDLHTISCGNC